MMGASKRLELRIQSPFPDYTPAFDNHSEDYFADLCVFLHDRDATPLLLHRVLLSRTSRTFEALLHGKKGSSTATYNPTTRCVKGLPPCDAAIVSLLRFCYGAKLTVNKDNAVLVLVALAFMKLKQKHNEIRAQIRTLIKDITVHRVADGLAMVRQGEDYDKAFDTTFCVGASIARVVFPVINIETSLQALTDTLITLSPEYLDIVNYGSDKSQAHEAEIRLAYVRHNTTTLSYDEAKKIVSPLCISKLPIPTVMQLASLELCDTKELAAVIQGLYNENQVLKRKLAEAEKAKHELAKRLGDDESEDDDDEAESEENAVAFALAYERLRRLLHDSCIFHPSRVLHEQSETCHSDKRNGDKGIKEVCQALMADTETTELDLSSEELSCFTNMLKTDHSMTSQIVSFPTMIYRFWVRH